MDKITLNMSRIIFVALMCLVSIGSISGQEYKYEPMVREGVKWYYAYYKTVKLPEWEEERDFGYNYEVHFKGDTVMNGGRTYKKLYIHFINNEYFENCDWPLAWLRETDKRVYAVLNEKNPFVQNDKMMTLAGPRIQTEDYDSTGEYLLYDFNNISATYNSNIRNSYNLFRSDSDLIIDGHKRVTYDLRAIDARVNDTTFTHYVAEGFGSIHMCPNYGNFIFPIHNYLDVHPGSDWTIGLTHITNDNGDILYKTRRYYFDFLSISDVVATPKAKIKVTQGLITAESADYGTLYLYTISGTLADKRSSNGNATCSIDTDGLAPGIYVAVWRGTSSTVSQKVVVQ